MIIKKIGRLLVMFSRLKKCLLDEDSMVDSIVELESPLIVYSRQDGILDIQEIDESYFLLIFGVLE